MIRSLVDEGLANLKFRDETHEHVADVLTRAIEEAGQAAVQAALAGRLPEEAAPLPSAATRKPITGRGQSRVQPMPPVRPGASDAEPRQGIGDNDSATAT